MSRKFGMITFLMSILAIILALTALVAGRTPPPSSASTPGSVASNTGEAISQNEDIQYVLYLGTNDKDTNEPVFSPEEAKAKAEEILINHFGGYTIQEASGGWIDGDKVYQEYTLIVYLSDTDLDAVHKAADNMIEEFRQSSVLIQANQTTTEFYEGAA